MPDDVEPFRKDVRLPNGDTVTVYSDEGKPGAVLELPVDRDDLALTLTLVLGGSTQELAEALMRAWARSERLAADRGYYQQEETR